MMGGVRATPHCTRRRFGEIRDRMLAVCPPPERHRFEIVRVSREENEGHDGTCTKRGRVFTIRISSDLTVRETVDTMTHEVAHALDWRPYQALAEDHGATFGVWYSRVYQAYKHER